MSVEALSWVLNHYRGTGAKRLVMIALANHADADGSCWPGIARIAHQAAISEKHAKRTIREMVDEGSIERHVNAAPDNRIRADRRPNFYVLTAFNAARRGVHLTPTGGTSDTDGGYIGGRTGGTAGTPESSLEPSVESSEEKPFVSSADADDTCDPPPEYSADFERVWSTYPRKTAKRTAWKKWKATLRYKRATVEQLEEAVGHYVRWIAESGTTDEHVMHGATFFGPDLRWQDYSQPVPVEAKPAADTRRPTPEQRRAERHQFGKSLDGIQTVEELEAILMGDSNGRRASEPIDRRGVVPVAELGTAEGADPDLADGAGPG